MISTIILPSCPTQVRKRARKVTSGDRSSYHYWYFPQSYHITDRKQNFFCCPGGREKVFRDSIRGNKKAGRGKIFRQKYRKVAWVFSTERESLKKTQLIVVADCKIVLPQFWWKWWLSRRKTWGRSKQLAWKKIFMSDFIKNIVKLAREYRASE